MAFSPAAESRLSAIAGARILLEAPLREYTRFGIGGPARLLVDTSEEEAFLEALQLTASMDEQRVVIGGGTNLIVADSGFDGIVLRYTGNRIERDGLTLDAQAGAYLQAVVDASISGGLRGLESMTGIPGFLGGAVYGNAGAYGRSMDQMVEQVRFAMDGEVAQVNHSGCEFGYRSSIFKARKDWVILSAKLLLTEGAASDVAAVARGIREVRNAKYPPSMKCAGSIFKNLFVADLPASVQGEIPGKVVREGKVPSAWFLEQVNAKGLRRGDIQVAEYHANLIYNDGAAGTSSDLVWVIQELKRRVWGRFGFGLEEEVQYVGSV